MKIVKHDFNIFSASSTARIKRRLKIKWDVRGSFEFCPRIPSFLSSSTSLNANDGIKTNENISTMIFLFLWRILLVLFFWLFSVFLRDENSPTAESADDEEARHWSFERIKMMKTSAYAGWPGKLLRFPDTQQTEKSCSREAFKLASLFLLKSSSNKTEGFEWAMRLLRVHPESAWEKNCFLLLDFTLLSSQSSRCFHNVVFRPREYVGNLPQCLPLRFNSLINFPS